MSDKVARHLYDTCDSCDKCCCYMCHGGDYDEVYDTWMCSLCQHLFDIKLEPGYNDREEEE